MSASNKAEHLLTAALMGDPFYAGKPMKMSSAK